MQDTDVSVEEVVDEVEADPAEVVEDADEQAINGESVVLERDQTLALRHVIERQITASQELSTELFGAATDVTAAIVESPAKVLVAVNGGATLPAALAETGTNLQEVTADAASRARSAVGEYVGDRAVLPNAVISGAAELAGSVARAQGAVASSAVNAAFNVATAAAQGGDVRDAIGHEVQELSAAARSARESVLSSASAARQEIRDATAVDIVE
jgi:hypothetical protein